MAVLEAEINPSDEHGAIREAPADRIPPSAFKPTSVPPPFQDPMPQAAAAPAQGHDAGWRSLIAVGKSLATLAMVLVAVVTALLTFEYYVNSPWTRNGSIRAQVANVAPQVSGKIVEVKVADNEFVEKGDVLFVIDPFDFEVALRTAKAAVDQAAADLEVKKAQADRRLKLSDLATTPEEQQIYAGNAVQAQAIFDGAQQQLARAELDLKRTQVTSPVDGHVTNLLLRVGDFALAGAAMVSVIDSDSFWVDGYFEETKLARICVGDQAEAKLLGYADPILGHVKTVTRGIAVANATPGTQGLPVVDPIYTWVRLAQRVPVRIAIDRVPEGVPLVSGMTATVTIRQPGQQRGPRPLEDLVEYAATRLSTLYEGEPAPHRGCYAAALDPAPETLPIPVDPLPKPPESFAPGLTPGIDASPLWD